MARALKSALVSSLRALTGTPTERLIEKRYERLMRYGEFEERA
jgi:acetyl-CoA carboxylase carboxyl transferase subunit alpha